MGTIVMSPWAVILIAVFLVCMGILAIGDYFLQRGLDLGDQEQDAKPNAR